MPHAILIPLIAILVSAAFGAVAMAWHSDQRQTRSMAALFGCTLAWGLVELLAALEADPARAFAWLRWVHLPPLMIGPAALWIVAATLPQLASSALGFRLRIAVGVCAGLGIAAAFAPGTVVGVDSDGYGGWTPRYGPLSLGLIVGGGILPVCGAWQAARARPRDGQRSADRRRQWGLRLGALTCLLVTMATELILPQLGISFPRLGAVGVACCSAAVWLSVLHDAETLALTPHGVARSLLAQLTDGVALLRLDGAILSANRRFAELAGAAWGPAELVGRPLAELVDAPIGEIRRGLAERASRLQASTGESIPISLSSSVARSRSGEEIGLVIVVRDQREIDRLRSRLLGSGRLAAIGELAAGIAHEVNNPVAFMRADLNLLRERIGELRQRLLKTASGLDGLVPIERSATRVERALRNLDRVTQVVGDVREFAHVGGPGQGGSDPVAVVEGTMRLARLERDDEVRLEVAAEPHTSRIRCGQELKQVLLSLLRLLAAATGKGGCVEARLGPGEAGLRIELHASPLASTAAAVVERLAGSARVEAGGCADPTLAVMGELVEQIGGRLEAEALGADAVRVALEVPTSTGEGAA